MKAYIKKIEGEEGRDIELVLTIDRPLLPRKSEYFLNDEDSVREFNAKREEINKDIQCLNALHLGKVELTQGADQ